MKILQNILLFQSAILVLILMVISMPHFLRTYVNKWISQSKNKVSSETQLISVQSGVSFKGNTNVNYDLAYLIRTRFVDTKEFLKKECSLAYVSSVLKTNRTYLAQIIRQEYGMSFPEFLHELRIKYIVEQMKTDLGLRQYTISHIASLAGYRSKRSFELAFKSKVGHSPASYIKMLDLED